ncbi:MAG: nicotinate-nucleotide adenylyltransferase [Alphaproteobacteria bacterium]
MSVFSKPGLHDTHKWHNMRIGLLGGSFNPPHQGHLHISLAALKGLKLDAIWWLVTPQNPLKTEQPAEMDERLALCEKIAHHPQIVISDIERELGTNITYHTVQRLQKIHPRSEFIWISGMDTALSFHTWNYWHELLAIIPTVHLTRNPATSLIRRCPLRLYTKQKHVVIEKAAKYPLQAGTTYWMMQKKMVNISSTELRSAKSTKVTPNPKSSKTAQA